MLTQSSFSRRGTPLPNSQNGFQVIFNRHGFLREWKIPGTDRHLVLRDGSAGFLLADFALWYHRNIEKINRGVWDEWGWAPRDIRGSDEISNHASGTAEDLNATKHPLGVGGTFMFKVRHVVRRGGKRRVRRIYAWAKIHIILRTRYRGIIRWGGDYSGRVDSMHFEINRPLPACERRAKRLMRTRQGRLVLAANPGARKAILS